MIKRRIHKLGLPLLAPSLLALSLGVAAAQESKDIPIPNTKVSYHLVNTSSVFIDADKSDDFVEFYCTDGAPVFYLNAAENVLSQADFEANKTPALSYTVDSQSAKTMPLATVKQIDDPEDDTHLHTLVVADENDAAIFSAFKNATSKVVFKFTRSDKKQITLTFSTKGFTQALKAVNNCK